MIVTIASFLVLAARETKADNYALDVTASGVRISTRIAQLDDGSGGKYREALAQLENTNNCEARVSFSLAFSCPDKTVEHSPVSETTLKAGQTQSGEGAGLWWRPCQHGQGPVSVRTENPKVTINPKCTGGGYY